MLLLFNLQIYTFFLNWEKIFITNCKRTSKMGKPDSPNHGATLELQTTPTHLFFHHYDTLTVLSLTVHRQQEYHGCCRQKACTGQNRHTCLSSLTRKALSGESSSRQYASSIARNRSKSASPSSSLPFHVAYCNPFCV